MRLLGAELVKLRTTRLYPGMVIAATGLVIVVTALQLALGEDASLRIDGAATVVRTPEDLRSVLNVTGVAAIFALVLGAMAVAGEHRHGTIVGAYLITPRRSRVVTAKLAAYSIAGAVLAIVVEGAVLALVAGWLAAAGASTPFGPSVLAGLALVPVATALAAAFGVGISAAVPNQLGAVLAALGWVMVIEQLLSGLLPPVAQWLPFAGANTAITGQHPAVGPGGGLAVFTAYLVAVVMVGIHLTRKRDI